MPRGSKSINRPPTPEPEDQSRELSLEEDIRLRVRVHAYLCFGRPVVVLSAFQALTMDLCCSAAGSKRD